MAIFRPMIAATLFFLTQAAFAQAPNVPTTMNVCWIPGVTCLTGGAAGASAYLAGTIVPAFQYIFYALAVAFFFYYAVRLILESEDENTITETKSAYGYAIGGAIIVALMDNILTAVGVGGPVLNPAPVNSGLITTANFINLTISAAASGMIVYQGFRMILLQGQESEMEQQKKRFFHGLIGVAVVLLAEVLVNAFLSPSGGSSALVAEIVGITRFILEIFGALVVLAFIVAGTMYVVSSNESTRDRAKKTIFATIVSMIVVMVSYTLIKFAVNISS